MDLDKLGVAVDWTETADTEPAASSPPTWSRALLKSASAERPRDAEPVDAPGPPARAPQLEVAQVTLACVYTFAAVLVTLLVLRPAFCTQPTQDGRRLQWTRVLVFSATSAALTALLCS